MPSGSSAHVHSELVGVCFLVNTAFRPGEVVSLLAAVKLVVELVGIDRVC